LGLISMVFLNADLADSHSILKGNNYLPTYIEPRPVCCQVQEPFRHSLLSLDPPRQGKQVLCCHSYQE
jgi:hypothetical protein